MECQYQECHNEARPGGMYCSDKCKDRQYKINHAGKIRDDARNGARRRAAKRREENKEAERLANRAAIIARYGVGCKLPIDNGNVT